MKILLISSNTAVSPYPLYPLGLSVIAGALTKAGHDVRQFDFLQMDSSLDALGQEIEGFKPELVGISIRNIDNVNLVNERYYIETVKNIVKKIKEVSSAKVVLGGAGFSLIPEPILKETGADYGVIGEGERLMTDFANNAAKGIYPERPLLGPVTGLSGTDMSSAKYDERLMGYYLHSGNIVSIQTKRGCTHQCVYCTYPLLEGYDIRKREPRLVVDDMELLRDKYNTKYIFFVDSVFNDDDGAYLDLINEMVRRKVNIPWTGFFKPNGLNDEVVKLMKETGLAAVEIGADAACDLTLKKMGKSFKFKDIIECNDLFSRHGVAASNFFMFSGPGENKETVIEGIENIKGLNKAINFIFMGIRILPNTPLAQIAIREGVIPANQEMLKPIYYLSPSIDRKWLEETLTAAFANVRHCIFPPDAMDNGLRMLHKMGYTGTLWDKLLPGENSRQRKRHAAK